jgi:hypothetical protein
MTDKKSIDQVAAESWPELDAFTAAMRARLEEKAPERGKSWKAWAEEQVLGWMNDAVFHLEDAIFEGGDTAMIRKKAVDVANFAMMIFDVVPAAEATLGRAAGATRDAAIVGLMIDPSHREGVRACRVCGCTDARACEGGCCWVEDPAGGNLCSRCAEKSQSTPFATR